MASQGTINDILHHFGYEWWMFRATSDLVAMLPDNPDPLRNAVIESMVMHGRALHDFFCADRQQDDWIVEDLGSGLVKETPSASLTKDLAKNNFPEFYQRTAAS